MTPEAFIRLPISLVQRISKDEYCLLAYFLTKEEKTLTAMNRLLGIGTARIVRSLSSLREREYITGKVTQPETIQVLPTILPQGDEAVSKLPEWVLLDIKSHAADKHLLANFFREGQNFEGTLNDLAESVGQKHRNANGCLGYLVSKHIIRRINKGHKIELELLERPKKSFFKEIFS
jgi:DNA-binding MarR family transcriptional regulator